MRTTSGDNPRSFEDYIRVIGDAGVEAARKAGPLVTSAVLATASMLLLAGFIVLVRSSGGSAAPSNDAVAAAKRSSIGETKVVCADGEEIDSSFYTDGDTFTLVGKLASVEDGGLLVKGPERYAKIAGAKDAAKDAKIEGGDVIKLEGEITAGESMEATRISLVCAATASPSATLKASTTPRASDSGSSGPSSTPKPTESPTAPTNGPDPSDAATPKPTRKPAPTEEATETPEPTANPESSAEPTATPGMEAEPTEVP